MRRFEHLIYRDWKYKIVALITAVTLWAVVNLGTRVQVTIEKNVNIVNARNGFSYKIEPRKVKITLKLIERLNRAGVLSEITAYVDVKDMKEGFSDAEVEVYTPLRPFISVQYIDPSKVKVRIISNRKKSYRNHMSQ